MSIRATGAVKHESEVRARTDRVVKDQANDSADQQIDEKTDDELKKQIDNEPSKFWEYFWVAESLIAPILFTLIATWTRFKKIDAAKKVVWDEAHFGKFGSYYIKHEFYHDVHPPLGKMLVGLSEYIAKFNGDFEFKSGSLYPADLDFATMRYFNAIFSIMCIPVTYFAAKTLKFQLVTVYFITLMVTLEASYIALGKFILLDSMLLFFTITTFLCFTKLHSLRRERLEFTKKWYIWMILTGISIGCVCSVKWVGLFITVLVGLYTVQDLYEKLFENEFDIKKYAKHWSVRILALIFIPAVVYITSFKVHFALLSKSGTGDASTSSLFQANLEGNKIKKSPRDIVFGSEVTIRSQGSSPNLLHSHVQIYPDGSNQQQITGYGHSDGNNNWVFKYSRRSNETLDENSDDLVKVQDGDVVRLVHKWTGVNLHSHTIPAHVSKKHWEVGGYGNEKIGDSKDDWVVEIVEQLTSANKSFPKEDKSILHPLSTNFRLRHADLGCYLSMTGAAYPAWGFKQSEVVCKDSWTWRDKSTWWNVEDHMHKKLEIDDGFIAPKSNFWSDFIQINFAMASSNNALVPDYDKFDHLASKAWEWPTLHVGLRMCGWGTNDVRYFLIGNPFNTWLSTISLPIFIYLVLLYVIKYQRQTLEWNDEDYWKFIVGGVYPFIGWLLHFAPFAIMGRVTYVHHYVPALYFAIYVFGFLVEHAVGKTKLFVKIPVYSLLFGTLIFTYFHFAPFYDGMTGPHNDFKYLEILPSWKVV
ncbi:dolichyl-phosphate-mannose-proteinmannosyltransferase [Wickerhamomyces ciferrii]|uniref:Dolichyl-phosphate-mannose--protein mannosyltransferase n=1 Tax=Wickerhamomyces ciferrii (strain ATCC 14091 / BCRC 22168 / CBS 111 / JCM 3599 / NBRC 0793 / NRRL Y-1031 F-60-10) TaxID=1206466 RepID=K0KH54_WICCF|nr:dolichyl-phosphate-mannose-proteinmannosyltransferase [Wickerhamomyces ciferrii]CCH42311.1 dolichyl-phosphate-mannose-proteinmannosyltransferase [Wickerhamomyces ciferrii]